MKGTKVLKKSIKWKILGTILIVIVASFAIMGALINNRVSNVLEEKAKEGLVKDANIVSKELDLVFEKYGMMVEQMVMNQDIVDIIDEYDDRSQKQDLRNYKKVTETLGYIKNSDKSITSVYIGSEDASDTIIDRMDFYTDESFVITERPWYQKMQKEDGLVFTDPYIDSLTKELVVSIIYPIKKNNKIIGAAAIDVSLTDVSEFMGDYKIGGSGYPSLIDSEGHFIYHPDKSLVGNSKLEDLNATLADFQKEMLERKMGIGEYDYEGESKYFAYVPMNTTEWAVGASIPKNETTDVIKSFIYLNYGMFLIVMLILIIAVYITIRIVLKNVPKLLENMVSLGKGSLVNTLEVRSEDEIGQIGNAYNDAVENIRSVISEAYTSSDNVSSASETMVKISDESKIALNEVSTAINEVAEASSEQAMETEKSVENIHGLSNEIEDIIQKIESIFDSTKNVQVLSNEGTGTLEELNQQSKRNQESVSTIKTIVNEMDQSSNEISTIVDMINDISGQTNLLALNASIEAARAGEAGKGFAGVADEIRKLAEQTNEATEEIRLKISDIQSKSTQAVEHTGDSERIVQDNVAVVRKTGEIFEEIIKNLDNLFEMTSASKDSAVEIRSTKESLVEFIEGISAASEETSASMEEMSATTEEQLAIMENLSSEADKLKELSEDLHRVLEKFEI
jgi:methyl-accepting chemotaxis protein